MAVGIAVRDAVGITHWAPFSEKHGKANDSGRKIIRELKKTGKPMLFLVCEGWSNPTPLVDQVRRVSTLVTSVTCMACIIQM